MNSTTENAVAADSATPQTDDDKIVLEKISKGSFNLHIGKNAKETLMVLANASGMTLAEYVEDVFNDAMLLKQLQDPKTFKVPMTLLVLASVGASAILTAFGYLIYLLFIE